MPLVIETREASPIGPEELVDLLESGHFDPDDEASIASFAPALRRLARNRTFLGDLVVDELKQRCAGQVERNHYSAQVILLHTSPRRFGIRANLWPAAGDSVVADSGREAFFYGMPHDHNFSFLTVGYLGPGYWSDYYEYDYERTVGFTGEKVELKFVERSRLSEGKVMLYRRFRDIHSQMPPDSLSVSLNIVAISPRNDLHDQYSFDLNRGEVSGIINQSSLANLMALARRFGGGNGRDLVDECAVRHPSERIRFAAVGAQASEAGDVDERIEHYRRAAAAGGYAGAMALRQAERLAGARRWMAGPPDALEAAGK